MVQSEFYGQLPVKTFFKSVLLRRVRDEPLPLIITAQDRVRFELASICSECGENFNDEKRYKVFHHSHRDARTATGAVPTTVIDILCSIFNLKLRIKSHIIFSY